MQTIAVIDYGMGNLHSVSKALEHVADNNTRVIVTRNSQVIQEADRVVFPGVGAIRDCMAEIKNLGFDNLVKDISHTRPFLGICVGMQALFEHSEENNGVDGIGLFPGKVCFFDKSLKQLNGEHIKVPHMGWNEVNQLTPHPLWHNIPNHCRFYFVHSYYAMVKNKHHLVASCHYGVEFAAAVANGSCFAVQFHPEKSHEHGLQLLKNFIRWNGNY